MDDGAPYLPGAAALLEQLDKRVMLILRDGRHLVGVLRSFDQYINLMLENTCERVLLGDKYCDIPLGLYVVRGDSIVLMGELDPEKEQKEMKLEKITPQQFADLPEAGEEGKIEWDFES